MGLDALPVFRESDSFMLDNKPVWRTALLFFFTFVLGAELGHWLSAQPGDFATFWPNSGLYLAALLRAPRRQWWMLLITGSVANGFSDVALHEQSLLISAGFTIANALEATISAALIRCWLNPPIRLDSLKNLLVVIPTAVLVGVPLGSAIGGYTVAQAYGVKFLTAFMIWWAGDALGILVAAPLVLSLLDMWQRPPAGVLLEATVLLIGLVVGGVADFTSPQEIHPIVLFIFMLWAAIRLGILGVSLAAFSLTVVAIKCTEYGYGSFAHLGSPIQQVTAAQVFTAFGAFLFQTFAVVIEERVRTESHLEELVRERTAERLRYTRLNTEINQALTGQTTMQQMLQSCAESLVRNLDGSFARIWTLDPAGDRLTLQASAGRYTHLDGPHAEIPLGTLKIGLIAEERKPQWTNNVIGDARIPEQEWAVREGIVAFAGFPLVFKERLVGVVAMFAQQALSEAAFSAMATAAGGIALCIERKEMERQVLEIAAAEQRRIGQELHDGVQQELTGLSLFADAIIEVLDGVPNEATSARPDRSGRAIQLAHRLADGLQDVRRGVQRISRGIVPVEIDPEGLRASLQQLAAATSEHGRATCRFRGSSQVRVANNITATHLYRIAQEALNNALRHGEATEIDILLGQSPHALQLEVADNGIGFEPKGNLGTDAVGDGMGLRIMDYRAATIGAELRIARRSPTGIRVVCTLPK